KTRVFRRGENCYPIMLRRGWQPRRIRNAAERIAFASISEWPHFCSAQAGPIFAPLLVLPAAGLANDWAPEATDETEFHFPEKSASNLSGSVGGFPGRCSGNLKEVEYVQIPACCSRMHSHAHRGATSCPAPRAIENRSKSNSGTNSTTCP